MTEPVSGHTAGYRVSKSLNPSLLMSLANCLGQACYVRLRDTVQQVQNFTYPNGWGLSILALAHLRARNRTLSSLW